MLGLYFEEFEVGQVFGHAVRRTVTEADNVWFSTATCNPAAIHLDEQYCREHSEFGQRIVNRLYARFDDRSVGRRHNVGDDRWKFWNG